MQLLPAVQAQPEDVLAADGYIFATPEMLAALSGMMRDFFDRTYYPALERINGRPYAILICAGSDGQNAARQIARIATGWRLRAVADPLIVCTHAQTPEAIFAPKVIGSDDLSRCEELGAALAPAWPWASSEQVVETGRRKTRAPDPRRRMRLSVPCPSSKPWP